MTQSYDFSGPKGGGKSFGRRPIVLARLPRVGETVRTLPLTPQTPTFAEATRFYVDPHHATPTTLPKETRQHDTNRAAGHRHHHTHRRPAQAPVATSLPARIAAFSGLLTTLTLAASVALLCWMIVEPRETATASFADTDGAQGATKIEIPYFEVAAPPPSPPQAPPRDRAVEPIVDNTLEATAPSRSSPEASIPETATPEVTQESPAPSPPAPEVVAQPASAYTAAANTTVESRTVAEPPPQPMRPAVELVPLPEIVPAPAVQPQVIYNDASAAVYPTTDHPLAADFTVTGRVNLADANRLGNGPTLLSAPQMAQQHESYLTR